MPRGVWMPVGTVKWYDCKKGFGFIIDPSGEDVLAHFSAIEGEGFRRLFDGEQVEYEAVRGPKGLHAHKVKRLNPQNRLYVPRKVKRVPGKGRETAGPNDRLDPVA